MILKELNLVSFGKFDNKTLELEDGLNILYGENETGKTTIHNFIDGMFYGFLRPYVTRRYYIEEYDKYKPWYGDKYTGVLRFLKDGKLYRIERDFGKGEVKVYDDLVGKDITKDIDTGEKVKVHLPGIHFFEFNTTVYQNTISIKQLGNKIDSNLSKEVKDRLANISTSLDDDISVKNAIADLEKQLAEIGTERAPTRPYGRTIAKLEKSREKEKLALEKQEEYNIYINEFYDLKRQIEIEENKIKQLQIKFDKAQLIGKRKEYQRTLKIKDEIEILNEKIQILEPYANISFEEYTSSLELGAEVKNITREIKDLIEKINDIKIKLGNIDLENNEGIIDGVKVEELYDDMEYYNEIEEEKNNLIFNSQQNRLEILNSELKGIKDKYNKIKTQSVIFIILAILSLGLGLVNPLIALLFVPLLFASVYMLRTSKKVVKESGDVDQKIQEIKLNEDKDKERIADIEKHQKGIILKYNCSSKTELNRIHYDLQLRFMTQSNRLGQVNELKEKLKEAMESLQIKKDEKTKLKEELKTIIFSNNSDTMEEFKEGLEKKRIYDDLIKDKKSKSEDLDHRLENTNLEELDAEIGDYDEECFEGEEQIDVIEITNDIKNREGIINTMRDEYSRIGERIDNLNNEVKKLTNIREEIDRLEILMEGFNNKIEAITMAKNTIESISQEIHNQFAPAINKKVSQMINLITGGIYDQVRINDELDIGVENPLSKEIIDIENLSGGTIDQLYFALRFSVISSIKGGNLPLILDDCFIQYDNRRLKNILKLLSNIGKEKQILLFTCHHREKEVLDNLGLEYNLIKLG